jgi:endonuclease/exonuclease/phosphatase family metal-dependent hydrolase
MQGSLRKIAEEMDLSLMNQPISLSEIGKLHRWGDSTFQSGVPHRPEVLSFRNLVHKHTQNLKFLWLNAYMIPHIKLDTPVYSGRVHDGAPVIGARAFEIGTYIKESKYDIVALCEVFMLSSKDTLISVWENKPFWIRGSGEGSVKFKIPFVVIDASVLTVETISSGLLTLLCGRFGLLSHSREAFTSKGDWERDADAWSNKGVLKVVAETGFNTKLEIYSTHLIYGGGLIGDISDEERYAVQRKQLDQMVSFIEKERNPSNFVMVVGDFNIYANEAFYQELRWRMEDKLGLEDVWTRYAIPRYGAKAGKTNSPSACILDTPPCDKFADDKKSDSVNEEGRIDYIFIQKPSTSHDMSVDISRPRRVPFKRVPSADGFNDINYFSDHVGIELQMFLSAKSLPVASDNSGQPPT